MTQFMKDDIINDIFMKQIIISKYMLVFAALLLYVQKKVNSYYLLTAIPIFPLALADVDADFGFTAPKDWDPDKEH